jgi:lysozyme
VTLDLVAFVAAWEGFREKAYQDIVGVWTIGYGFTQGVQEGDRVTRADANFRLEAELGATEIRLRPFMRRIPSKQQADALISLAYNCGVAAIGKSGLMTRFNDGDDEECAKRFLLWSKAGGRTVAGLYHRRAAEMAIYTQGDYSGRP